MTGVVHQAAETLSCLLNTHYAVVTSVVNWTCALAITVSTVCRFIYQSFTQTWNLAVALLVDTLNMLICCGRALTWLCAQLVLVLQSVLSTLEVVALNVYQYMQRAVQSTSLLLYAMMDGLSFLLHLPHTTLAWIDTHLMWCYGELSDAVQHAGSKAVTAFTGCLHHVLLVPYYLGSYLINLTSTSVNFMCRLVGHTKLIVADATDRLAVFYQNSSDRLHGTFSSVASVYLEVGQNTIVKICTSLNHANTRLIEFTNQMFITRNLWFDQDVGVNDLFVSICLFPLQVVNVVMRDLCLYNRYALRVTASWFYDTDGGADDGYSMPLPNIARSVQCVFEELIWVAWLAVNNSWPEILVVCIICTTVYLVIKQQSVSARHFLDLRQQPSHGIIPIVDIDSETDSDLDEDDLPNIHIPPVRAERFTRARSRTPDLSLPGSETRYIRKLKQSLDDEINSRACTVCQENTRNILLLPCRHLCVCSDCTRQLLQHRPATCPLCRAKINQTMDIYL